ncbi:DUF4253 domain-containing protein [Amycolatopsis alkalitolerans]|uniref:DUF4253 domain-containing protein n=1 Tax=Amycolatopsis alkalitolerans TaxID=2547244 RepID=A0A5C4M8S7_9PSEU|nr:DUF4253 domain-containing protein [Amycolatopsis alkalitolerans]TNC28112.1 DUF4253 domain-containing protein [Amycolatopsis alkalitolerans]
MTTAASFETLPGLHLPAGHWHGPIWLSDEPLTEPGQYRDCIDAFERTGLWPVLVPHDERFAATGEDWVDDRRRLGPAVHRIETVDVGQTLARWWDPFCCAGGTGCLRPYGANFPGLARKSQLRVDPLAEAGNTGSILARRGMYRLGLVAVERPADVPATLGWTGMIKSTDQVAAVSAVLRSWEDRFGATLVVLGFDELELSVAAPPRLQGRALVVAAEHRAFSVRSFSGQPGNLREYAASLVHKRHWRFSWD